MLKLLFPISAVVKLPSCIAFKAKKTIPLNRYVVERSFRFYF